MRTLRSRTVTGDEDTLPSHGEARREKKMEVTSDDEPGDRRVTRSMKSTSSGTAKEMVDAGEDSGSDINEGVENFQKKTYGKRRRSAGIDISERAEAKLSSYAKIHSPGVSRRVDKGKGLESEAATLKIAGEMTSDTVFLSSEDEDDHGGGTEKGFAGALGRQDGDRTGNEDGIEGASEMRIDEIRVYAKKKNKETPAKGETSRARRTSIRGKEVAKKRELNLNLAYISSSNSEGETEEIQHSDGFHSDSAGEEDHKLAVMDGLRSKRRRQASPAAVEPNRGAEVPMEAGGPSNTGRGAVARKRALDIARSRAAHFAHFNIEEENNVVIEAAIPSSVEQAEYVRRAGELLGEAQADVARNGPRRGEAEDWPGPFTVARRLVEGRVAAAVARQDAAAALGTTRVPLVNWLPSRTADFYRNRVPPSLHEKCLEVLCRNINHVVSLDGVPDSDKNWLVNGLCAQRKLTPATVAVCMSTSPTQILIPDCTCLTEEDLTNTLCFGSVERLEVLELTMCGRGITDHCLATVCAKKGNLFPELRTVALRGAYRLVDQGLSRILDAAPKLKYLDLSLCSLISESSVEAIADKMGPTLESLVLDGCCQLSGLKLLPALRRMGNLQRLSLSGLPGVTDGVISELLVQLRFNLQELELRACQGLTDAGIQAVSLCQGLKLLDIGLLPCLTDVAIGLIGDNCRNLKTLRLCRGKFTDQALAAFVNASGSCLSELSLNSARRAGDHTVMALAMFSKASLEVLDLSWCRSITDQALGLLGDSCRKLRTLRLFGCTQVTNLFLEGHSNEYLKVTGIWECPTVTGTKN